MDNLKELEKKYKELGKEIERLKKEKTNKRWRATDNWKYYFIDTLGNIYSDYEDNTEINDFRYEMGNYFKTDEEAEKQIEKFKIYMQLKDLALRLNNGEKIDWNNEYQCKYYFYYDFEENILKQDYYTDVKDLGQIHCLDDNFKDKALEEIGEENLKLLFGAESGNDYGFMD